MAATQGLQIEEAYREHFAAAGLSADTLFSDPRIHVWRDLPERQNAIITFPGPGGIATRWHVKRYLAGHGHEVRAEIRGIRLLQSRGIGTVPLVGHGQLAGNRAVLITDDLGGYLAGDKLPPSRLLESLDQIVALAAKLHDAGLHHRDLYLCHFFIPNREGDDLRLIDAGRVAELPRFPLNWRWVIKDVAQLIYSLRTAGIESQAQRVLDLYCRQRRLHHPRLFAWFVQRKVASIARHDRKLRATQPTRNVSLGN